MQQSCSDLWNQNSTYVKNVWGVFEEIMATRFSKLDIGIISSQTQET